MMSNLKGNINATTRLFFNELDFCFKRVALHWGTNQVLQGDRRGRG